MRGPAAVNLPQLSPSTCAPPPHPYTIKALFFTCFQDADETISFCFKCCSEFARGVTSSLCNRNWIRTPAECTWNKTDCDAEKLHCLQYFITSLQSRMRRVGAHAPFLPLLLPLFLYLSKYFAKAAISCEIWKFHVTTRSSTRGLSSHVGLTCLLIHMREEHWVFSFLDVLYTCCTYLPFLCM